MTCGTNGTSSAIFKLNADCFKAQMNLVDICDECDEDEEKGLLIVIAARMNEGGCKRLQRLQRLPIPRHVSVRLLCSVDTLYIATTVLQSAAFTNIYQCIRDREVLSEAKPRRGRRK